MVQVDVFWSYGLGAGFALAAARQLRARHDLRSGAAEVGPGATAAAGQPAAWNGGADELRGAISPDTEPRSTPSDPQAWWPDFKDLLQNRYMLWNILYAALLFAPSGIYLVWGFPEWETMQAGTHAMAAWLIVGFAITNVTQAILAFWVTERLIVHGRQYLGFLQVWFGYFAMFFILVNGWDRTGWHRFFSENRADFLTWNTSPALDQVKSWVTSDVALTLYAMGVILIPVMALMMVAALRGGYRIGGAFMPNRRPRSTTVVVAGIAAALLSGVPVAIVAHQLILWFGWILGLVAAAVFIYALMLRPAGGLLYRSYRMLALEDDAYDRVRSGTPPSEPTSRSRSRMAGTAGARQ